jgi:hypothetical protein
MTSASRRRANALIRYALAIVPPERRDWAEAMRAEVAHLPDPTALTFAWGCLWAAIRARAASPATIVQVARWGLVVGAVGWGALHLWLAGRLPAADAPFPAGFAYAASAVYAIGALVTALLGLRATAVLILPALALSGIFAVGAEAMLPHSPHGSLYQALAIEEFCVLLVALLIAAGAPNWSAARERIER